MGNYRHQPVQAQIDVAIDNEANTNPAKALEWSEDALRTSA